MKHLLSIKIITLLLLLASMLSHAEGIGPGLSVPANGGLFKTSTYYAYKKGTEQISLDFKKLSAAGTGGGDWIFKVYSPSGNLVFNQSISYTELANTTRSGITNSTEQGIWTILVERTGSVPFFITADVNVKTSTGSNIPGRVYTNELSLNSSTMPDFSIYTINQYGYKYTTTFYALNPIYLEFRVNPYGVVLPGTCTSAYKSYTGGDPRYALSGPSCGGTSKIFFNSIAEDVPANAPRWDLTTNTQVTEWLNPGVAAENVTGLTFAPTEGSAGAFNFTVANYIGNATLKIDVNNNGVYTDAVDRSISAGVTTGSNSIAFDGKNGSGAAIPCGTVMKAQLVLDKPGEIHFVLADAEGLGGIKITRTTGAGSPSSIISWDDSNVYTAGKTTFTNPITGTNVNSSFNATTHGWGYDAFGGWGNESLIDNWAFLPGLTNQEITFSVPCPIPDLTPNITVIPTTIIGPQSILLRVRAIELNDVPTTGTVSLLIRTSPEWIIGIAPNAVVNGWTYAGISGLFHRFTTNAVIRNGYSQFDVPANFNPNGATGQYTFTTSIPTGSGGESPNTNNADQETISYQP